VGSDYLLLLLPDDFFSPPWLLRLLLPLLPRARSLCASLFWLLALAPLLAAWERLLLPEDFELRDAIDISLWKVSLAARAECAGHTPTLRAAHRLSVGCGCGWM
jgi:hypothetical protein